MCWAYIYMYWIYILGIINICIEYIGYMYWVYILGYMYIYWITCVTCCPIYIPNIYILLSNTYASFRLVHICWVYVSGIYIGLHAYILDNMCDVLPNIYTQYICTVVQHICFIQIRSYVLGRCIGYMYWVTSIYIGQHMYPIYIHSYPIYITVVQHTYSIRTRSHICWVYVSGIYLGYCVYVLDNMCDVLSNIYTQYIYTLPKIYTSFRLVSYVLGICIG